MAQRTKAQKVVFKSSAAPDFLIEHPVKKPSKVQRITEIMLKKKGNVPEKIFSKDCVQLAKVNGSSRIS